MHAPEDRSQAGPLLAASLPVPPAKPGRPCRPHIPGGGGGAGGHHRCFCRPGRDEASRRAVAAAAAAAPPRGRPHLRAAGGGARPDRGTEPPSPLEEAKLEAAALTSGTQRGERERERGEAAPGRLKASLAAG